MRLLIAEDDATSRFILESQVHRLAHDVVSAGSVEEAWALFQENDIDVVISDRTMPSADGLELCRRVRAAARVEKYVYFIFVTSAGEKIDVQNGMAAGQMIISSSRSILTSWPRVSWWPSASPPCTGSSPCSRWSLNTSMRSCSNRRAPTL